MAFIFAASVIWLLFDMAALRLSFSEINAGLLKEDIIRREHTGFRVEPDQVKVLYTSIRGMGLPRNGAWGKENFRKAENHELKVEENMDQVQRKGKMQNLLGRRKAVPLWHLAHLQTLPVTIPMQKTQGRDSKPEVSSQYMMSKWMTVLESEKTPFTASRGVPLTKIAGRTETFDKKQEAPQNYNVSSDTSKQASERTLNMTISVKTDRSKQKSQTVTKLRMHFASPPILKSEEVTVIKKAEAQSKDLKHEALKALPLLKFIADMGHLKNQSTNETQLGRLPEDDAAKVAPGKKLNFSESHVVIITKEEELKTDTKEVPNSKTQTVFPKLLGGSPHKQIPRNQSKTSSSPPALKKAVSQSKPTISGGLHTARSNLTAKAPTVGYQQSHANIPENPGMHHVFRIDVTLSPRDLNAPGQFGRPVVVPPEKKKEAEQRWKEGNFNVYLSDLIPVDRAIEDTRPAG